MKALHFTDWRYVQPGRYGWQAEQGETWGLFNVAEPPPHRKWIIGGTAASLWKWG